MNLIRIVFLMHFSVSLFGCATSGLNSEGNNRSDIKHSLQPEPARPKNQYGWDDSNCAHIMANGHCFHPTGINIIDSPTPNMDSMTPNPHGWNSSNCAHITADGNCAHEL